MIRLTNGKRQSIRIGAEEVFGIGLWWLFWDRTFKYGRLSFHFSFLYLTIWYGNFMYYDD